MTFTDPHEDIADALRGEFHARAAHLAQTPAPFARIEAAARRDRIRRRSLAGCAGVALVAALATSVTTINGVHHTDSLQTAAGTSDRSPLLDLAPRGNLVANATFMQEVATRLGAGMTILYANDDGTHTVVIGAGYQPVAHHGSGGSSNLFSVLTGAHGASAADLSSSGEVGLASGSALDAFSYVGVFRGTGGSVPYVVLGPTDMTQADIASGIELTVHGGKLAAEHTALKTVSTQDGAVAGEISDPSTSQAAGHLGAYISFRGQLSTGKTVDANPLIRTELASPSELPTSAVYDALRSAIVAKGRQDGLAHLPLNGPGGDAVTDNAAQVVADIASIAGVDPHEIDVTVDWVGQETSAWDTALLDIDVPGLPHIQAFVRGLAPGQPDSESPGLEQSFVRPAQNLTAGHFPETAAAFGGTPELSTLGQEVVAGW
ncbi:hypothetical protein KDL01_38600 [Actinospica durhamensis]|uniref:Uncharacterized protein n=1 Tax=Actinospica durhamensis TaxID=1508375 RepID=A0A941EXV0_9ACTN|nr:hypothetical protein [Actinospica durhamensis]MBR7839236.1 hypothetical protein [Actinospica durhamensis]